MNAKESSKVGNQRLQRAVKKKIVEEKENKVKLPQIDVKKRGKNSKKTSKEESCQDDVNITIEELVPPLVSIFLTGVRTSFGLFFTKKFEFCTRTLTDSLLLSIMSNC